ncbi:MAG TPA: FtsX-like permease family protein, partial [Blastocatellia bacterium]|nr:FtsX-like permease family protein [Blastocatellia bacterium]
MRISTIALANLRRRKAKAAFLIMGMAIGIGTAVALLSLSFAIKDEIGVQLDQFGANIVVVPQSNSLSLDYGGVTVSGVSFDVHQLKGEDATSILDIAYGNRLSIIAPKILGAIQVEGRDVLLAGVDFPSELKLKRWWLKVGREPQADDDLLVGYDAARTLGLIEPSADGQAGQNMAQMPDMPGMNHHKSVQPFIIKRDRIQLAGREHRVASVLVPTGGREDAMIFGSLAHVQALLGKPDQLSLIEVSALCQNCPVEDIVAQISEKLPYAKVSAVQQSVRARTETVERLTRFSAAVSAVVLAIGSLMIFTTMMGSVVERTKEIGVMRAIGFRRTHIIKGLMIEVAVISVAGGVLGWLAGILASWAVLPYFAEGAAFRVSPLLALASIAAAIVIGAV